jgi:predicted enzyme related to lactoylglutathione lyase
MQIRDVDVGFVSATTALVDFYAAVLDVEPQEPRVFPFASVHRIPCGPATLKVMVPTDPPSPPPDAAPFWGVGGLRYLTLWVDDLDALALRWERQGGRVATPPFELRPGVRTAVLSDPDGNTVEAMQQD